MDSYINQNAKLEELYKFLKTILDTNRTDSYINTLMDENRIAIFTRLLLLLENVHIN